MSDQFIGEIRWFPYIRGAPSGWVLCDGSLLAISNYDTLYVLLGTTYGGDGVNTFGVPDLRGRVPIHQGTSLGLTPRALGMSAGQETVTLNASQLGGHSHVLAASTTLGTATSAANATLSATSSDDTLYITVSGTPSATALGTCVSLTGGGEPHDNCAPTLPLNPCIAFAGVFPSQG